MKPLSRGRRGFSLPDLLAGLLVLAGVLIFAFDLARSVDQIRAATEASVRNLRSTLEMRAAIADISRNDRHRLEIDSTKVRSRERPIAEIANDSLTVAPGIRTPLNAPSAFVTIRAQDGLPAALGLDAPDPSGESAPIGTVALRINAPSPCSFDAVARTCREDRQ